MIPQMNSMIKSPQIVLPRISSRYLLQLLQGMGGGLVTNLLPPRMNLTLSKLNLVAVRGGWKGRTWSIQRRRERKPTHLVNTEQLASA
ncbi:hypothetical protein U1Q18_007790 [Sarracenia purpurea var. burkii]